MSTTVSRVPRAAGVFVVVSGMLAVGCAGPNASRTADMTARSWSTDQYVAPTDPRTTSMNAARVLAMPERAVQRTMQVGAVQAVIHANASATSAPIGILSAGQAVKVLAEADFVRIPPAAEMREYIGVTGGELTPSWVKVSSKGKEGWVPARALVLPVEFATASDAMAASRASGANKGFSEKVKKDARAMKGAAGTPALKGANYATADAIIESAQKPLDFSKKSSPWAPATRITAAPALGEDLKELDPAAAAAAAAALAKVNEPGDMSKSMDAAEGASGLLGSFGISQAEDPSVKTAMQVAKAVAQILDILGKTTPVTPVEERALGRECLALLVGDSEVLPP